MPINLDTSRFLLTGIEQEDQGFVFEGLSHPLVIPYYGVRYETYEATSAQMTWYREIESSGTGCWWKIVDRFNGHRLGACGYNYYNPQHQKAELGYWLLPDHWGRGIMKEVLPVLLDHLFSTVSLHRLEAVVEVGNEQSSKLSEKLGFVYEGTLRECELKEGKRISLLMYSLLAPDWYARRS